MARDAGVRSVPELRDFGKQLQQMGEQMYGVMVNAQRRMNYVSDKNERFKVVFDQSVKMIKKMSDEFARYNDYLQKQCNILDQYKGGNI